MLFGDTDLSPYCLTNSRSERHHFRRHSVNLEVGELRSKAVEPAAMICHNYCRAYTALTQDSSCTSGQCDAFDIR